MNASQVLQDEIRFLQLPESLTLECGATLHEVTVAYQSWGTLNAARDNAVLVCHALTGSADAAAWWPGMFGAGRALDPARDFILCSNVLGGCYGTTGPADLNPVTGRRSGGAFPLVTVRDMVRVQAQLLDAFGIEKLALAIGGSLGGMQVLEWAAMFPERVVAIAPIAVGARQSSWAIGWSEAQRQAIFADSNWRGGNYLPTAPPAAGLAAARAIAMLSYRHWQGLEARFGRKRRDDGRFDIESWLQHHGNELVRRFDAASYVTLTRAMDSHDLGHERGGLRGVLRGLDVPALVVGIPTDLLYPPEEQQELAALLPRAQLEWLHSPHGHDAFLIETETLNRMLRGFRAQLARPARRIACKKSLSCPA